METNLILNDEQCHNNTRRVTGPAHILSRRMLICGKSVSGRCAFIGIVVTSLSLLSIIMVATISDSKPTTTHLPPAGPSSLCHSPDTAGGDACHDEAVEVHGRGTICLMPKGGYDANLMCTWHIHCSDHTILPVFKLTQLQTKSNFDGVSIYDYDRPRVATDLVNENSQLTDDLSRMAPLTTLTGSFMDQNITRIEFEATRDPPTSMGASDPMLSVVFHSEKNFERSVNAQGFAGEYNCYDRCTYPSQVDCGTHGQCIHGASSAAGICKCNDGWGGTQCEIKPCEYPHHNDCNGHGTCHDNNECLCEQGYIGTHCEIVDPLINTLEGHSSGVESVAYDPTNSNQLFLRDLW
eukprot:SAG11_NODE_742_length_7408_cov_21.226023_4_plen_351_part_00